MAEPAAAPSWLRRLTLACVVAAQIAVVLAIARVHPSRLAREEWTQRIMLDGMRALPPAGLPQSVGMVELYRDGAIVILTAGGLDEIRIDADTVVRSVHGPDTMAALRPGLTVAVWGPRPALRDMVTARAMLVL